MSCRPSYTSLRMGKGAFTIAGSNAVDPELVFVAGWDRGQHAPANRALLQDYIGLVHQITGGEATQPERQPPASRR